MTIRIGVYGATGYAGLELVRLLLMHPEAEIRLLGSNSQAGEKVTHVHPQLQHLSRGQLPDEFTTIDARVSARETDVLFLALPSGTSGAIIAEHIEAGCRIIDLSGDMRIPAPLYQKWYGLEPVPAELLARFTYGLSELFRREIQTAQHISNPGCYATAVQLALAPLLVEGVIRPDSIIVDAKSGVSGAGRSPKLGTLYSEVNENMSTYKVGKHQHTPEIEYHLQRIVQSDAHPVRISFTPQLVPLTRGILCTLYADLNPSWSGIPSTDSLLSIMQQYYADAPFVRVREQMPSTKQVWGSNYCDIGVYYEERTGRITLVSVIDNLVKGASGQAIQNMNLMFGLPETAGLDLPPVMP